MDIELDIERNVYLIEGQNAYTRGLPLDHCPYPKPTDFDHKYESANAYNLWNQGWHQSRQRAEGRLGYTLRPLAFVA